MNVLIDLQEATNAQLLDIAKEDAISRAQVIRHAIAAYVEHRRPSDPEVVAPTHEWPVEYVATLCGPCSHLTKDPKRFGATEQHCGNTWRGEIINKARHVRQIWGCVCPTCRPASEPSQDAAEPAGEPDDQPATPEPPPPPNAANGHAALVMASQDERSAAAEPEPIAEDAPATPGPEPETVAAKEPPEPPAAAYTLDYSAQSAVRTLFDELSSDREIHPSEAGIRRRLHTDALKRAHTALTRREGSVLRNALRERETWTEPTMSGQQAWLLRCIEEWLGVLDPDQA